MGCLRGCGSEQPIDPAHLPALRSKYSGPVLSARAVVAVAAGSDGRSMNLLTRVVAVLRARIRAARLSAGPLLPLRPSGAAVRGAAAAR